MKKYLLMILFVLSIAPAFADEKQSAYDRVMDSGKIRCGYVVWEPGIIKDANTGKLSGIFYDMMNEVGTRLSLKIDWVEETGWSDALEALNTTRFDAICSHFWATSARARRVDFSIPLHYSKATFWVRADDKRFDKDLSAFNDPKIKLIYIEGTAESQLMRSRFPKASFFTMPQLTPTPEEFLALKLKKGDAIVSDPYTAYEFVKANPGVLKEIHPDQPLNTYPNVMMLPGGEYRFNQMINNTIRELQLDGTINSILDKYKVRRFYTPVAQPYQ